MTFSQSISTCFSKYANFKGRASRSEYWWWQLFVFITAFVIELVFTSMDEYAGSVVEGILQLVFLLPNLAVAVRRCHDTNHSGWWIICPIYNIILMFMPSDPDANDYGTIEE